MPALEANVPSRFASYIIRAWSITEAQTYCEELRRHDRTHTIGFAVLNATHE